MMLFDDLGMTLSLPYNFQPDFIDQVLLPFTGITEEVYLSMHWAVVSTARIRGNTDSHRQYLENVDGLFKVASRHNIRLNFIANISIENGPDLTVSDLDAGLPVFEKAGKFGISYQSDKLTDEIRTGIKKLSEVLLELQTDKAFRLNFLPTSLELKKAFTGRHVKVTLKQKSLQPRKHG